MEPNGATLDPSTPTLHPPPAAPDSFDRQLLGAMFALRNGEFSVRLPVDLAGIDGKVADAFNDIAAVSERRALETSRVSRMVGKEGKLKQRMAVPGVVGGRPWPSRSMAGRSKANSCGLPGWSTR